MRFSCGARSASTVKEKDCLRTTLSPRHLEALLGIALGGSKRVLILFCNSDEEAQRLIHCICIWEGIRDIRL